NPLGKAYSWKFSTIAPQLQSIYPSPNQNLIPLETSINVQFNQPMDSESLMKAFALRNTTNGATVAGQITFNEDKSQLTFTPTSRLERATRYQVTVLGRAKSASGTPTLTTPTTVFSTPVPSPAVAPPYPADGAKMEPGQGVSISFSAP